VCECACERVYVCVCMEMYILEANWNNKTDLNFIKYSIILVDVLNFNPKLKYVKI